MITAEAWRNKKYAVYGLARSGLATVRALVTSGAEVTAWDDREEARGALFPPEEGGSEADGWVLPYAEGGRTPQSLRNSSPGRERRLRIAPLEDLSQFHSLVVSPGVPLNTHPLAAKAREAGVEIIGDIELFARARAELPPHKVVGITGTNGKSTTTALVHHILKTAGVPTTMGGNIGLPILAQDPLPDGGVYVLELSSYQIDLTQSLDCDVAVLLNITPDHLARYDGFEAYAASKARLFAMQSADQTALVDWGLFERGLVIPSAGFNDLELPGSYDQDQWPALQGPHNRQNAAAAIETAAWLGVEADIIAAALASFPGLPHRMERVRELNGTLFVNDSKATNAEAAAPALAAFPRIRWIVGGQAKTEELGNTAKHLNHVVRAYTIGEAGPLFALLLRERGVDAIESETLENAVKCCAEDSQPGETVLLSPACASFDQFRDFEARGKAFKALVGAL